MNRAPAATIKDAALSYSGVCLALIVATVGRGWEGVNHADSWVENRTIFEIFAAIFTRRIFSSERRPGESGG